MVHVAGAGRVLAVAEAGSQADAVHGLSQGSDLGEAGCFCVGSGRGSCRLGLLGDFCAGGGRDRCQFLFLDVLAGHRGAIDRDLVVGRGPDICDSGLGDALGLRGNFLGFLRGAAAANARPETAATAASLCANQVEGAGSRSKISGTLSSFRIRQASPTPGALQRLLEGFRWRQWLQWSGTPHSAGLPQSGGLCTAWHSELGRNPGPRPVRGVRNLGMHFHCSVLCPRSALANLWQAKHQRVQARGDGRNCAAGSNDCLSCIACEVSCRIRVMRSTRPSPQWWTRLHPKIHGQ